MPNNLFLDDLEVAKLSAYQLLQDKSPLTISALKKELACTEKKAQTVLLEIEQDLKILLKRTVSFSLLDGLALPNDAPNATAYRQFLFANSLLAQAFIFMVESPHKTIQEFCQENYLSRATVFRRLKPLQSLLAPFHLKFNISQLQLTGDELAIRYLLCNIFWLVRPNLIQNFSFVDPQLLQLVENIVSTFHNVTAYGSRHKLALCLHICQARRLAGFYIEDELLLSDLPLRDELVLENHAAFREHLLPTTPPQHLAQEELGFYFLIYTGAIYVSPNTLSFEMFQEWWQQPTPEKKAIADFGQLVREKFFKGETPVYFELILANIMGTFNASALLQGTPPMIYMLMESSLRSPDPLFQELEKFCLHYLQMVARRKNFAWLKKNTAILASIFAYFLWPSLQAAVRQTKLRVSVLAEDNFILMLPLYAFLRSVSYVELLPYEPDAPQQFDLVIFPHHSFQPTEFTGPTFLYTDEAVQNNFACLNAQLKKLQVAKFNIK